MVAGADFAICGADKQFLVLVGVALVVGPVLSTFAVSVLERHIGCPVTTLAVVPW